MEGVFRYRSQTLTAPQVEFIRQLIAQHPGATRRRLSLLLCEPACRELAQELQDQKDEQAQGGGSRSRRDGPRRHTNRSGQA